MAPRWTDGPTNGERWHYKTPAEVALLDQLRDQVAQRDVALGELPALKRVASAARNRLDRHTDRIEELERQAATTRRAFEVLRGGGTVDEMPTEEAG